MNSLKNLKTEIIIEHGKAETLNYVDLCNICLNTSPQGGLTVEQIKSRLDVRLALDSAKKDIKFTTTAQIDTLKTCVKSQTWAIIHKDVVGFSEAVEKL